MSDKIFYICTKCFNLTSLGNGTQRCECEPSKKIEGIDSPSGFHLCYICCVRVAGGTSRWSWEACEICLEINKNRKENNQIFLPLGRHSVMNGVAIPLNLEKSKWDLAAQELVLFTEVMQELETWCVTRAAKMFADVSQWADLRHVRADTWEREFSLPIELEIERSRKLIGVICGDVGSR